MAISYVGVESNQVSNTTTDLTINTPAGTVEDTVLVACITSTSGVTEPAGWTSVTSEGAFASRFIETWVYVAPASPPASHTFTMESVQSAAGAILAFDGVDTADPVDVFGSVKDTSSAATTSVLPSVTTTEDGCWLVGTAGGESDPTAWTTPAPMTERSDLASTPPSRVSNVTAEESFPTAGATGTRTFTANAAGQTAGIIVALKPGFVCIPVLPDRLFIPYKDRLHRLADSFTDIGIARAQDTQFDNWKAVERWAGSFMHDTLSPERCHLTIPWKDHAREPWPLSARQSFDNWKAVERWAGFIVDGSCGCSCDMPPERLPERCLLFIPYKDALATVTDPTDLTQLTRAAAMEFDNYKTLERWAEMCSTGDCICPGTEDE